MKKFLITGSAVVILAGGYSALWFYNKGHLVQDAETQMTQVKNMVGPDAVTYSSLQGTGFPTSLAITLKDLKLNIMNMIEAKTDTFTLKRGIVSNCVTQVTPSDVKITISPMLTQGEPIQWDLKSKDAKTVVSFHGHQFMNFLTGKIALNPLKDKIVDAAHIPNLLLNEFKSFESSSDQTEVVDSKTGQALVKCGPTSTKFSMDRIDDTSHKISIETSMKDLEVSQEVDKMFAKLADTLHEMTGADTTFLKFMRFSAYGKASSAMSLTYKGPTDQAAIAQKGGDFNVDLAKYETSDNMQKINMKGNVFVKILPNQSLETVNVTWDGTYQVTQAFQDYMKTMYKELAQAQLDRMAENPEQGNPEQQKQAAALVERIFTMYGDRIFPDLAKLGVIKTNVDFRFNQPTQSFKADLSLLTDKYGIVLKGEGSNANKNQNLDVELTIKNYVELLDALYAYAKDMIEVTNEVTNGAVPVTLNDELKLKLIGLLEKMSVSKEKGAKDLVIKVDIKGDQVKVGNMNAAELMMAFMMLMPQVQAGVAGPGGPGMPGMPGLPVLPDKQEQ